MTVSYIKLLLLLLFSSFCLSFHTTFSQTPDYSGTWLLNREKSKLGSEGSKTLTNSIFIIEQRGDKFTLTRYHVYDAKKKKLKIKMTADGKARKMKLLFNGKLEWLGDSLRASVWRKNFSNIVCYKFGENTNEFIADEVFKAGTQHYHNYWVFARETKK
ncbi:MAG: hypothetical protein U0X91_03835 [Spirosomataceae bacterium]